MRWIVIIAFFVITYGSTHVYAENVEHSLPDYGERIEMNETANEVLLKMVDLQLAREFSEVSLENKEIQKKKIIALTLAVTLGVFGVHRLYLGTATKVPIIYTLTLGGGFGFLVVSDIVAILATKNINKFSPNSQAFMWAE